MSTHTKVQIFPCTINEGHTEEDLRKYIVEYLQTARSIKGAGELEMHLNFAVAPQSSSIDIVAIFPSFAAWGHFTDDLPGSPLMEFIKGAEKQGKFTCSGGKIWDSVPVTTD